ncbi:MAG: ABC transporter substrate-binding protein, partial [Devosia sp.]
LDKLKQYGIVVSGDAVDKGIGCITDAREKDFFSKMVAVGLFDASMDYTKAFTTQFVCKGVGTELTR